MWEVENSTPFATAGNWIRDRDGAEVWIVAVRCTFRIRPDGRSVVEEKQDPPVMAPMYRGDPSASSLLYDSDFYLTKPTTDVMLHGHAYAPNAKPTTRVDVTMRVGEVSKTLQVTGKRIYQKGIFGVSVGSVHKFTKMPITYEGAYGGQESMPAKQSDRPQFEALNPIGRGFAPVPGDIAPNVSYRGLRVGTRPAGFGPIPSHWYPRVKFAGTYDKAWQKDRMPLYPKDLDDRFFLCSPEDQRPKNFLRGGEPVELINLAPAERLVFVLPRLAFRFETQFRGKPSVMHRGVLHTVILEPDVPRVVMVWHTSIRAHIDVHRLTQTFVTQLRVINSPPGSIPVGGAVADEESEEPE